MVDHVTPETRGGGAKWHPQAHSHVMLDTRVAAD